MRHSPLLIALLACLLVTACSEGGAKAPARPRHDPASLAPITTVPSFSFEDQRGERLTDADLRGKVWVAQIFLVCCPGRCPMATKGLQEVFESFPDDEDLHMFSITADPEKESKPDLAQYAKDWKLHPERWHLVRASKEETHTFVEKGLLLPNDTDAPENHTFHCALVDRSGKVRGYYRSLEKQGLRLLKRDIRRLLDEEGQS